MIIVTDKGFSDDPLAADFTAGRYGELTYDQLQLAKPANMPERVGLVLTPDSDVATVAPFLDGIDVIKVPFTSFADGRGFSIARELRRAGFKGAIRAVGHVIPDQYAHARRSGFDEVAISSEQADRQPANQWLSQVDKINQTYQNRLQQAAPAV